MELDIKSVVAKIGIPVERWAGDCSGISAAIILSGVLRSLGGPDTTYRLARGHWVGPVHALSHFSFARGLPFIQHSWIQAHGLIVPKHQYIPVDAPMSVLLETVSDPIIDPTRFAFDGRDPYIYIGEPDHYDEGGNAWRMATMDPCPTFNLDHKVIALTLPPATMDFLDAMIEGKGYPYGHYTYPLLMWLGNLSPAALGGHARPLYAALVAAGQRAIVPQDNYHAVMAND